MIRRLFSKLGDKAFAFFGPWLRARLARTPVIWGDASRLTTGRNVVLVDAVINLRSGSVTLGDDVFLGHGVMLLTGKHDMTVRGAERHLQVPDAGRDIVVENGVWIASGAIIIGPCHIGQDAVIGAGAVVTGTIAVGTITTGGMERRQSAIQFKDQS